MKTVKVVAAVICDTLEEIAAVALERSTVTVADITVHTYYPALLRSPRQNSHSLRVGEE